MAHGRTLLPLLVALVCLLWSGPATAAEYPQKIWERLRKTPAPPLVDPPREIFDHLGPQEPLPAQGVQPGRVYILSGDNPDVIRWRGGFLPIESFEADQARPPESSFNHFVMAASDAIRATHNAAWLHARVNPPYANLWLYELVPIENTMQLTGDSRDTFVAVYGYGHGQIRSVEHIFGPDQQAYRVYYCRRHDQGRVSQSWGGEGDNTQVSLTFLGQLPRPVGFRGQLPLIRAPATEAEGQRLVGEADADLERIVAVASSVHDLADDLTVVAEGQTPSRAGGAGAGGAGAAGRVEQAEADAADAARRLESIVQRSNAHSFLGPYHYDEARASFTAIREDMNRARAGLARLLGSGASAAGDGPTLERLASLYKKRRRALQDQIKALKRAVGTAERGAGGSSLPAVVLLGWESSLESLRRELTQLEAQVQPERDLVGALADAQRQPQRQGQRQRQRQRPAPVRLSQDETDALGIDWRNQPSTSRQNAMAGSLTPEQCSAIRPAVDSVWRRREHEKREARVGGQPHRGNALDADGDAADDAAAADDDNNNNNAAPEAVDDECTKLNKTLESIRSLPPCTKLRNLVATLRVGNDVGAGTYDSVLVAVEKEYQPATRDVKMHYLEPTRQGSILLYGGDIAQALVRSSPVDLADIGYVGLYDASSGYGLSGDAWEMEAFYLSGACDDGTPREARFEFRPASADKSWFKHSGKPVIIHDENRRRKRKSETNRVWHHNITMGDWKHVGGLPHH